ncbi:MAG TPA: precorrin-6A/cobalt-precorrin-6A reductase [Smithellaceae bacterium]|nr:precorrin-6A/cobalt-precorrin-6A reductase [Smithellaceae bacterium]
MIMVVGDTKEGREIVQVLRDKNKIEEPYYEFRTIYGETISRGVVFLQRGLNCPMTAHLIRKYKVRVLIDTIPIYFKGASTKVMSACKMTGVRYIKIEPPTACLIEKQNIYKVGNMAEACDKAMNIGKTIFLNIGNNNLNIFTKRAALENKRIIVRVSEQGALTNALKFGIERHDVLFINGIFSEAFNRGLIKEYDISVFVTRDLGSGNGTDQELSAAAAENIPVVLLARPSLSYPEIFFDYNKLLREIL